MKRVITLGLVASVLVFAACKGGSKKEESSENATSAQSSTPSEEQKSAPANAPKEYAVTITPDSAILGKQKEALVKEIEPGNGQKAFFTSFPVCFFMIFSSHG